MSRAEVNICFHGIGRPVRPFTEDEGRYWISEEQYHEILDVLTELPPVRLSFDDGNASDLEIGLPGLLERKLRADFFALAGRVGEGGSLGEDDLRTLLAHGMGVGSHGWAHRSWRGMDAATTTRELVDARERLSAAIGQPVTEAALPMGQYDRQVLGALRRLGYRRVYSSDRRPADWRAWLQPRYSVVRTDTAATVRAIISNPPALARRVSLAGRGLVKRLR
jgi:peptidoglycan/xylan/chitin deacetylase (PgdA/CDA1 family)